MRILEALHTILVRLFPAEPPESTGDVLIDIEGPDDTDWGDPRGAAFLNKLDAAMGSKSR